MNKDLRDVLEDSIAIIGMAGRFPGAENLKQFWENITSGKESITFFSEQELLAEGISRSEMEDPAYVKAKGLIKDIDKFDARFFNILPKDAVVMDPQHRILLETVWTALEDAGYYNEEAAGRIAVFTGCGFNTYYPRVICANPEFTAETGDFNAALGNGNDYLSTFISYKLDLTGPSITVQTACSTSLVAVSLACNSLLEYQSDLAIAGGASAFFPIKSGYHYQKELMFSADGHCRALDANSTGTLFSMGVGIVILKRLVDAIKDKNHIYAVIRGAAVNNDGAHKVGYTAPAQSGQAQVIEEAQTLAQIDPSTIQYIEAHATGTPIGDPIEIAALTEAFRHKTDNKQFCALGTLKSNIGHLDAAAGIAGLIKAVLVLNNKKIPPAANFQQPNPMIHFEETPFYVPTTLQDWDTGDKPRRAAVSSFGVGGTNAHIVLEEAIASEMLLEEEKPSEVLQNALKPYYLITLSARTETALQQRKQDLLHWMENIPKEITLEDISFTLNVGRKHFEKRFAVVVSSIQDLHERLTTSQPNKITTETDKNLQTLAERYIQGDNTINWQELHQNETQRRISLPTYPFERVRYWVPRAKKAETEYYFYQPIWQAEIVNPSEINPSSEINRSGKKYQFADSNCLLFSEADLPDKIVHLLQTQFKSLKNINWLINSHINLQIESQINSQINSQIKSGDQFADENQQDVLHPTHAEHYQKLLQELIEQNKFPQKIIYHIDIEDSEGKHALEKSFYSVFLLTQALLQTKPKHPIDIIYSYVNHPLVFSEPFFVALSGFLKTISQEYPVLRTKLLSIDVETAKQNQIVVDAILETLINQEKEVHYQNGQRQVKRFVMLEPETSTIFRSKGIYLITGGASGLGWLVASYLASTYQARLILIGRSTLTENQLAEIKKLNQQGSEIVYETCDVANHDELKNVINRCHNKFGGLNGIIHCAGVIHDALILKKSQQEIQDVFSAKIQGTLNLDELTQRETALDCFILFSSVAALFGNLGQADYAYANAFMDAFAGRRNALQALEKRHGKTLSINWIPWEKGGMQVSAAVRDWLLKMFHFSPLTNEMGLEAFIQAASQNVSQLLVLSGDKEKMDEYFSQEKPTIFAKEPVIDHTKQQDEIEQKVQEMLVEMTQLSKQEFDRKASLFEIGLDSIILAQLISKIEKDFGITLEENVQDILMQPTIENIAQFIRQINTNLPDSSSDDSNNKNKPFSDQIVILHE